MESESTLCVRLSQPLARTLAIPLLAGLAGAYPTWRWAGGAGLQAEMVAVASVMIAATVAMLFVVQQARHGRGRLAISFVMSGVVKALASVVLAGATWRCLDLPNHSLYALAIWVCVCYFAVMIALCQWMVKLLRQAS